MKKTSTIGVDLGDHWSCYCVLDEAGKVILEQKVAMTPEAMKHCWSDEMTAVGAFLQERSTEFDDRPCVAGFIERRACRFIEAIGSLLVSVTGNICVAQLGGM
jgi:hypothetical protein